ncbi:hypothetical protein Hypma_000092 [Hypsizygus marmoreus]|uniref:Uncharacterized protein n=1 Tax=Hypsizygus marmoreus TaxID=39966 RepID=A0A369K8Y2_HYPMA|nr:hypothetical protein Hypma_000092 [Hypsizygus marmoreus]
MTSSHSHQTYVSSLPLEIQQKFRYFQGIRFSDSNFLISAMNKNSKPIALIQQFVVDGNQLSQEFNDAVAFIDHLRQAKVPVDFVRRVKEYHKEFRCILYTVATESELKDLTNEALSTYLKGATLIGTIHPDQKIWERSKHSSNMFRVLNEQVKLFEEVKETILKLGRKDA